MSHYDGPKPDASKGQKLFIVGVDESHVDSHEALLAARSFAKDTDLITLLSVVDKTKANDATKKSILSSFVTYAQSDDRITVVLAPKDTHSAAETLVNEAKAEDATMMILGSGTKLSQGTLGGTVSDVVKLSKRHILVNKPGRYLAPGKPKIVLFGTLGSDACHAGLVELTSLLNPATDKLAVVTVSHHNGERDKAILKEAQEFLAGTSLQVTFDFVARTPGESVSAQLIKHADAIEATLLACATSRNMTTNSLGSTTAYVASHGAVSTLILKVGGMQVPHKGVN